MGKFEHYNTKYRKLAGTALKQIESIGGPIAKEDIEEFNCWDTQMWGPYLTYSQEKVEWAVYHAEGFEDWQKFRVSMKGHSTKEKLFCLGAYFVQHLSGTDRQKLIRNIRINNYLGALIRGGQLNRQLEVVR